MSITPELVTAIFIGIGTLLTTITTLIITLRTKQKVETDAVIKDAKLKDLHVLVNGRFTRALEEIADLRELIADRDQTNSNKALAVKARNDAVKSAEVATSVEKLEKV